MRRGPQRLCSAALAAALGVTSAHAQQVTFVQSEDDVAVGTSKKENLSPAAEKKFEEFFAKIKAAKAKAWHDQMQTELEKNVKEASLGDDAKRDLQAAADKAVADAVEAWTGKAHPQFKKQIQEVPQDQLDTLLTEAAAVFDRSPAQALQPDPETAVPGPVEQPAWIEALKKALPKDQFAAWNKAEADRKASLDKEIGPALKANSERIRTQEMSAMMATCKGLETDLKLDPKRSDQLETLAKEAVDEVVNRFNKRVSQMLAHWPPEQLQQMTRQGISFGQNPDEKAAGLGVWKFGLAKILTPEELKHLGSEADARRSRREHAMGQLMIVLLDQHIAFTSTQRQKFTPVADRLVKDIKELYPEQNQGNFVVYPPHAFYASASVVSEAELKPIFDEAQRRRWKDLAAIKEMAPNEGFEQGGVNNAPEPDKAPADVEQSISTYLYDRSELERKDTLSANMLKVEDATRVAGLGAATAARLETAARGVTEESLVSWRSMIEQQIRSQLQDPTPLTIKQRLAALQPFMFQQRVFFGISRMQTSNDTGIWEETVKSELSEKQQEDWKKETDARADFRTHAIAGLVVAEFDRSFGLSAEQSEKLLPLVYASVHDYELPISQMFGGFNGGSWFMGSFYSLVPVAGISDTDLNSILTKDQIAAWKGSQEFNNANSLWANIQVRGKQMEQAVKRRQVVR